MYGSPQRQKHGAKKIMKPYKLKLNKFECNMIVWSLNEMLESPKLYWMRNVSEENDETYREAKELIRRIEKL